MDELIDPDSGLGFEVLAASLRADLRDSKAFLGALGEKLGGALPQQCRVERRGGMFAREKPVRQVSVELGEHRYQIESDDRGGLRASRVRVVRGIALKTDELPVDTWIEELSREVASYAARHAQTREALERLLT